MGRFCRLEGRLSTMWSLQGTMRVGSSTSGLTLITH